MRTWVFAALALAGGAAGAQEPAASSGVEKLVEQAMRDAKFKPGKLGIVLSSASAGSILYRRNADEPLILASNTKLLTTAAALARLGSGYYFQTVVALEGDKLHVFGGGDPSISARFFDGDPVALFRKWAEKLAARKVAKISELVLHPGRFDRAYLHPDWIAAGYDQDEWWCAPVGALSLNENCVDVTYEGAAAGEPARVAIKPETAYVRLVNRTRSVKSGPRPIGFVRRDGTNEIVAQGEVLAQAPARLTWVTIQDPTQFFGAVLKETLERSGIAVGGVVESDVPRRDVPGLEIVATFESDLGRSIKVCNSVSQNFYAEMICKTLGAQLRGEGTAAAGTAAVREFLEKEVGASGASLADGSGLSRRNRASAAAVHKLLEYMRRHREASVFRASLATSGTEPGTLARRMKSIPGKVRAKTGHVSGVATLSGYLETATGDTIVFSILCNGWSGGSPDRFQDRLLELLYGYKGD